MNQVSADHALATAETVDKSAHCCSADRLSSPPQMATLVNLDEQLPLE